MPVTKLTGAVIKNLKPGADGSRAWHWDVSYKGLCLRVGKRDKTWSYVYRFDGKQRNQRIGKFAPGRSDHMDRAAAIVTADEIESFIENSIDPKSNNKPVKPKPGVSNVYNQAKWMKPKEKALEAWNSWLLEAMK